MRYYRVKPEYGGVYAGWFSHAARHGCLFKGGRAGLVCLCLECPSLNSGYYSDGYNNYSEFDVVWTDSLD